MNNENKPYFDMLDTMQEEGSFNMMHGPKMLREMFDIGKRESIDIASAWIKTKTIKDKFLDKSRLWFIAKIVKVEELVLDHVI